MEFQASTPVNIEQLKVELSNHPDSEFVKYLCSGLTHGFDPGIDNPTKLTTECRNNRSAKTQPLVVEELLQSETDKGYLLGPFPNSPFEIYRISPIGIAEGKYSKKKPFNCGPIGTI